MKRFEKLERVENVVSKAVNLLKGRLKVSIEKVPLSNALGRIAAREYRAHMDLPPYNRSLLDGFAVRSVDVAFANPEEPAVLRIIGRLEVNSPPPEQPLCENCAYEVDTGAPLPPNADVVVPQEVTIVLGDLLYVYKSYPPGYGVMRKGEDVEKGLLLISKGEVIDWVKVGMLASQGIDSVEVFRFPKVALFSIGDEVVEPGSKLEPGKVYNSTRYLIKSYLSARGFNVIDLGHVGDIEEHVEKLFLEGLSKADVILSIGGSSVGKRDVAVRALKKVVEKLDGVFIAHGIAMRPGRPAAVAIVEGKLLMCLSGFPVAAWTQTFVLMEQIIYRALGLEWPGYPKVTAKLVKRLPSHPGILDVVRARACLNADARLIIEPLRLTGSGVLSTLLRGNVIVLIPEDRTGYEEGELVEAFLLHRAIPVCGEQS